jgi:NitT/TauT family transport system substrate-binding protein
MRRRRFLATIAAPAILSTLGHGEPARADGPIRIGTTNAIENAPLFIAQDRGFFSEQGIDVQFVPFARADDVVAPTAAGAVDVAGGVPSATLYNAIAGGATLKVVADMGMATAGFGYNLLVVRKALSDSGKVKAIHDLKGLTVADVAAGSTSTSTLNEALKSDGLTLDGIKNVKMSYAEMEIALKTGTIDAALFPDPEVSDAIDKGYATALGPGDTYYLNQELAVLIYSGAFITRLDVARKFMLAYLKGVRFFLGALHNGHFTDVNSGAVIDTLLKHTAIRNPLLYTIITPAGINPNGTINTASMSKDLDLMRKQGFVTGTVTAKQCVDSSFVNAATRTLGRV